MASPFTDTYAGTNVLADLGDYAWYYDNSYNLGSGHPDYGTNPAGTKLANAAGLYDMSGNVFEWCWDWYEDPFSTGGIDPAGPTSGTARVRRSGGWNSNSSGCTVAYRASYGLNPNIRNIDFGFRLACAP
jgi:formylglycine-generating enzyme required for sulfatase activity